MESFYILKDDNQIKLIEEFTSHVQKRTGLSPVIMLSIPTFKLTSDVMLAFDVTKTYLGLYTTDQEVINKLKPLMMTAIFGNSSVKINPKDKKAKQLIKIACDEIIMKHMTFNACDLLTALNDPHIHYRDLAYEKMLDLLEENDIPGIDYKFFLFHEKKDYVLKGMGMLLRSLQHDKKHDYDKFLVDYLKVMNHKLFSVVYECVIGLNVWLYYKPYLKQTIKSELKGIKLPFLQHQVEKIKIEIEKLGT